jgi:two-component system CheB/CheR fusion protein
MLAMFLRELGHSVQIAGDGEGAIRVAEEFKPDVMFLDIGLPGMDGYEVARRLRQSPTFHETKLIALTGYGDEKHVRMSKEAGFDSHMVKPMDFGLLGQELGCLFN